MPGFNQKGPQGSGPMTGRGRGGCANTNMTGAGAGYGAGSGRRGCGRGFGGNGGGRRMGARMGQGFRQGIDPASAPLPGPASDAELQERARMLEEALNAVNARLNTTSEAKKQAS